jgi:hypothetical protein
MWEPPRPVTGIALRVFFFTFTTLHWLAVSLFSGRGIIWGGGVKRFELKPVLLQKETTFFFFCYRQLMPGSRDSVVGIPTGYGLDDRGVGVRVPVGSRIFSSPRRPDRLWGPPNLLSKGYPGVKRPGRAADHSSPASAGGKKMWT